MELSTDIEIKQENYFEYEESNTNFLDVCYDIKVEADVGFLRDVTENDDWCVKYHSEDSQKSVSYEELMDYCILKCQPCCRTFTNRYQLLKHNICHLEINIPKISLFQCNDCPNQYFKRSDLIKHIKTRHTSNSLTKMLHKCLFCNKVFRYSSWYSHMKEVHGKRQYKCHLCGYGFKATRYLKRHIIYKHQGVPRHIGLKAKGGNIQTDFKCDLCPSILNNKHALKTHKRNCHSDKQYQCDLCYLVFKSRPYLYCHLRRMHVFDINVYKCEFCHFKFKWQQMLDIHISTCKKYVK